MTITEISIKRPAAVSMFFLAIAVLSALLYPKLPVDLLPKMEWPWVVVITVWPGAGPQEVESMVSKPLEDAVISINKLKHVRSYNNEGVSVLVLEFDMSADADIVAQETQRMINANRLLLPDDVEEPMLLKSDLGSLPIIQIALSSDLPGPELHELVKQKIVPRLQQISGVGQVQINGAEEREIQIAVDPDKLKAAGLSIAEVNMMLSADNLDVPAGKVYSNSQDLTVRIAGKFIDLEQVGATRISLPSGGSLKLRDIATVTDTIKAERSIARLNGERALGISILKQSQANSVQTSDQVRRELARLEEDYKGLFKVLVAQDITQFTRNAITGVQWNLLEALSVVALVLLIFLHSLRSSFIVLIAIPLSLISAFLTMKIFDFSINLMTLMSMSMVIGVLVDDSIVVLENIHRWLVKGYSPVEAAIKGRNEIGLAAVSITMVDVVVFLPVALLTGIVGAIFREFSIIFVTTVLMSLLVSFTVTPLLASRLNTAENVHGERWMHGFAVWFEKWFDRMKAGYRRTLVWALAHRPTVIIATTLLMLGSFALIPLGFIGTELFSNPDRGEFVAFIEMPLGTPLEETDEAVMKVDKFIREMSELVNAYTVSGQQSSEMGLQNNARLGSITITLVPEEERTRTTTQIKNEVTKFCKEIPGMNVTINDIGIFGMANSSPIQYELRGTDLDSVAVGAERVMELLRGIKGTRDVKTSYLSGSPELQIVVDREKAAQAFLTPGQIAMALRNAVNGEVVTRFRTGDIEIDVRSIATPHYRSDPSLIKTLEVKNPLGKMIKIGDVASVERRGGPSSIQRKDRQRLVTVSANLIGRSLGEVQKDFETGLKKIELPQGVSFYAFGDVEAMRDMMTDMMTAIFLSILFVYMILVVLYESYIHPFAVMFSVPVAIIGALVALALTGSTLSMFSMISILILMGLVTKNGILLIDFTNQLRAQGYEMREALLEAGPMRLRPILMTTVTMIVGMLPLAIGAGAGGEFRSGMGVVIIGGLTSSLLLTLVLVPVMYTLLDRFSLKKGLVDSKK